MKSILRITAELLLTVALVLAALLSCLILAGNYLLAVPLLAAMAITGLAMVLLSWDSARRRWWSAFLLGCRLTTAAFAAGFLLYALWQTR